MFYNTTRVPVEDVLRAWIWRVTGWDFRWLLKIILPYARHPPGATLWLNSTGCKLGPNRARGGSRWVGRDM